MHDKFKKMLAKKKDLPDHEKKAKMDVIGALRDDMHEEMKKKLPSMKKVSVASDSPEGLKAGLDKAKQIVASRAHSEDADEMNEGGIAGYAEGGEVEDEAKEHLFMDEPEEESEKYTGEDDDSASEDEENEFHGLDMNEVNDKLQKLMEFKKKLESKSSK